MQYLQIMQTCDGSQAAIGYRLAVQAQVAELCEKPTL